MTNLYNTKLKIGKRSYSTKFYAKNHQNILDFVNNNLKAKVVSIEQIVYEAPASTRYDIDDTDTYKGTMYFMVSNDTDKKVNQIIMQTIKNSRSSTEVFNDMKQYLELDLVSSIKSLVSVNVSSR